MVTEEQENIEIVKKMFENVGSGNIPAALEMLAEEVIWQSPVTQTGSKELSWFKPRYNRSEVGQYFKELREKVKPEKFELLNFIAQGDNVAVEGKNKGTVTSTGKIYEHNWVMIFEMRNGKIVKCLHYYDTMDLIKYFY